MSDVSIVKQNFRSSIDIMMPVLQKQNTQFVTEAIEMRAMQQSKENKVFRNEELELKIYKEENIKETVEERKDKFEEEKLRNQEKMKTI